MKVFSSICLLLFSHFVLVGQEMLGIVSSNFSGIYGISLNPSSMVGSRLYMDYNLLSLNSSFVNNYIYIERSDYADWLFNGVTPVYYTSENEERNFNVSRNSKDKYGFYTTRVMGPGAMIVDGDHAYGITTSYRTNFSFHNLPQDISNFLYEAIDYDVQHRLNYSHDEKIQIGALSWFEINLSYAYNFHRYKWDSWTAGITIKPLLGYFGTYTNLYNVSYLVHNDTVASVYSASFDYAYSLPIGYSDNNFPHEPFIRGFGFGADIGITYAKTTKGHTSKIYSRLCEQRYEKYNYKIAVSLLDFGYIRFSKNAQLNSYSEASTEWYKPYDTLPTGSVDELNAKIESYFKDSAKDFESKQSFNMNPPPCASLQIDYPIKDYFFINMTMIWGFNIGKSYIKRPSLLSVAPRFETARIEVCMPVSIYEWNFTYPQIGLAIRYGNFFFGTDKLSTFIGINDFAAFDFYLGLRLNISNTFRMNYIKEICGRDRLRNIEMFDFRNF